MADQYIQLPDGSYGQFDANASDDYIRAAINKDFPGTFPGGAPSPPPQFSQQMANQALAASGIPGGATVPGALPNPKQYGVDPGAQVQNPLQRYLTAAGARASQIRPYMPPEIQATSRDPQGIIQSVSFNPSPENTPPSTAVSRTLGGDIAGGLGEGTVETGRILAPLLLGEAVNTARSAPHPQATANLAAAADVGGKPSGVTQVYEDLAQPGGKAYRDAAARQGVVPEQNFQGRRGYQTAVDVSNRMQSDAAAQGQPYFDLVKGDQIPASMRARVTARLQPIWDALPPKLQADIQNAQIVGDYNEIRSEMNRGGGRYFNSPTDAQFAAPALQRNMADVGNLMREEVYGHIANETGVDVSPIKRLEGNAINLRTQFEKAAQKLSAVADQAEARPTYFQRIRSGETGTEIGKAAVGLHAPDALEIFNTRMQRATKGGDPTPIQIPTATRLPSGLNALPPAGRPSSYFPQTQVYGTPVGARTGPLQLQGGNAPVYGGPAPPPTVTGVPTSVFQPPGGGLQLGGGNAPVYSEPTALPPSRQLPPKGVPATQGRPSIARTIVRAAKR